jgi:MFS superfamily sulfate permease-like transporter
MLFAGLTTAAVVISKAMAFAAIAGLPLEIGLCNGATVKPAATVARSLSRSRLQT